VLRVFSADNAPAALLPPPPIDAAIPALLERATFGVGCFWAPDAQFGVVEGVWRTRVGYAGGTTRNPTYRDIGHHTEVVQIDFDPTAVSYESLLEIAMSSHDPFGATFKEQYASMVLAHDDAQLSTALAVVERLEATHGRKTVTRVESFKNFYLAEHYHQKYNLRSDRLLITDFRAMFSDDDSFRESTAAARVNGYIAGDGRRASLERDLGKFGLTLGASEHLAQKGFRGSRSGPRRGLL
jgi:methionine-S-sulfoxide reductase